DTQFAVFGLGDSSYVFFNEAARKIDEAFEKLGGQRVQQMGQGDDQHPARFDTELEEWSPDFYDNIEAPEPPQELSPPSHLVEILPADDSKAKLAAEPYVPHGSKPVQMNIKRSTVPDGYERAIDHFEFDLKGSGLSYEQGDSLGLWPSNAKSQVDLCLMALNMKGDEILSLRPVDSNRSVPLPEVITARTLLTQVLDIAGWPKRRFYEMLKLSATDEKEKEVLVDPLPMLDMGVSILGVRDSWRQHQQALESGERHHLEALKITEQQHVESQQRTAHQHQESVFISKDQHDQSLQINRVLHDEAISTAKSQHEEQMKHSYMETRRENLRDLLSETLDEAQSTVLKSTLLFGFVVAVLVEGFPSAENSNERYIDIFIFSVSWAICLLFESIVLAGLYQMVQTRALREMIRSLQASASPGSGELRRSSTLESGFSSLDSWEPTRRAARPGRPYSLLHPRTQKSFDSEVLPRHSKSEPDANSWGTRSTQEPSNEVPSLNVSDPKRLLYRKQAKQFTTIGSLFTLICLAGLIYGQLCMRRGSKHGEGSSDVLIRLGIFLPPFVSAMFTLLLRKNANLPIRSTLAAQSLALLCFFLSSGFLLVTTVWWHASAPSINLAHESAEVYLKGVSLEMQGWPMFFHPTGVAAAGRTLLLSAAFRVARFELGETHARLVSEATLPALEIGDLAFFGNSSVALAGRDTVTYLPVASLMQTARLHWRQLPSSHFGRSIQDPTDPAAEALQDMLVVSKADLGVVACRAHDEKGEPQPVVQAEMMVMEKFGAGTAVSGLHVDPVEQVLYVLFHRTGRHAEIHAIDLHDELGRLLRVLRLPDVDSADGPDADHDVVWGALSSWHPPDSAQRPRLLVVTRSPAKVFSFELPNLRQCPKEELQRLCSKEGKQDYQAYAAESYTYAELLQKFPSCQVNIGHLLDYVPDIKPRLYSIASSSRMRGDDECHLCIIRNDWTATSGRQLTGLSTRWLCEDMHPEAGSIGVHACVHPSAVSLPEKHTTPMLMVALGTGIAPMRAFIEERASAKRDGEECGPMALFFGARNRQEYSYEAEFDAYQKEGVLTDIHLALSREQKEKIYVTHRLQQQKQLVYDLIHQKEGNLYLCGPGGNVPPQVRQAVIDAIVDGGHSASLALDRAPDSIRRLGIWMFQIDMTGELINPFPGVSSLVEGSDFGVRPTFYGDGFSEILALVFTAGSPVSAPEPQWAHSNQGHPGDGEGVLPFQADKWVAEGFFIKDHADTLTHFSIGLLAGNLLLCAFACMLMLIASCKSKVSLEVGWAALLCGHWILLAFREKDPHQNISTGALAEMLVSTSFCYLPLRFSTAFTVFVVAVISISAAGAIKIGSASRLDVLVLVIVGAALLRQLALLETKERRDFVEKMQPEATPSNQKKSEVGSSPLLAFQGVAPQEQNRPSSKVQSERSKVRQKTAPQSQLREAG
ncbi:unnamed protein product, partial [Effrenium voratum]